MTNNRISCNVIDFVMNLQIVCLTTHLTFMPITNSNLTLYLFPIRIIPQALPVFRRPPLLVLQSVHLLSSMGFLQLLLYAIHGVVQELPLRYLHLKSPRFNVLTKHPDRLLPRLQQHSHPCQICEGSFSYPSHLYQVNHNQVL